MPRRILVMLALGITALFHMEILQTEHRLDRFVVHSFPQLYYKSWIYLDIPSPSAAESEGPIRAAEGGRWAFL